jgi:hypothetical protein
MPGLLSQHAPTWLTRLPPWIADAAPPTDESLYEPSRMLREISALLEAMALEVTTVIVLDDLHWADLETVELLRALARWHAPLRTMILATYSPGATTVTAAALRSLATELRATGPTPPMMLGPLQEDHVRTYLTKRFGGGSIEALARMVHRLSGGNPLVMVSAMDALINGARSSSKATAGDCVSHRAPSNDHAFVRSDLILWRFDQLEAEDAGSWNQRPRSAPNSVRLMSRRPQARSRRCRSCGASKRSPIADSFASRQEGVRRSRVGRRVSV